MLSITISDDATPALELLAARATDLSMPMQAIASAWRSEVADGFARSTDPYGRRWAGLRGRSGQPLLDTGRLRNSFQAASGRDFAAVGTNLVYAEPHQKGMRPTVIRPKNGKALRWKSGGRWHFAKQVNHPGFPARKMLPDAGLPNTWKAIIDEALLLWMEGV